MASSFGPTPAFMSMNRYAAPAASSCSIWIFERGDLQRRIARVPASFLFLSKLYQSDCGALFVHVANERRAVPNEFGRQGEMDGRGRFSDPPFGFHTTMVFIFANSLKDELPVSLITTLANSRKDEFMDEKLASSSFR